MPPSEEVVRERLARLIQLQGSAPGFYMLSVHSFWEFRNKVAIAELAVASAEREA
jgi:hypothetical protein